MYVTKKVYLCTTKYILRMVLYKSYKSLFMLISFQMGEVWNVLYGLMDKGCRGLRLLVEGLFAACITFFATILYKVENWNSRKNSGIITCIVSIKELFLAFAKCARNDRKFLSIPKKRENIVSQVRFAINTRAESKSQVRFAINTRAESKSQLQIALNARAQSKSQLRFAINTRAQSKSQLYFAYFTRVLSKSQLSFAYITNKFLDWQLSIACITSVYSNWQLPMTYFRFNSSTEKSRFSQLLISNT